MSNKKLPPMQKLFVQEYLVDLNATQACIRAGYSEKTAQVQGSRLLSNVMVQALLSELQNERSESVGRTAKDSIFDIIRIAKLAEDDGQLNVAMKGYELEAKHHGAFVERFEHSGGDKPIKMEHDISPVVLEILDGLNTKQDDV